MLEGARSVWIPTFENQNGRMMEGSGGASIIDLLVHRLISGRHTAVGDFADFQDASDEHTELRT